MSQFAVDTVRLAVVGDVGVGKTAFVNWLVYGSISSASNEYQKTFDCNLELFSHRFARNGKEYLVEIVDVGGNCKHPRSRAVFYRDIDGVILVHDLSQSKTFEHLFSKWLPELQKVISLPSRPKSQSFQNDSPSSIDFVVKIASGQSKWSNSSITQDPFPLPVLVVGTKQDQVVSSALGSSNATLTSPSIYPSVEMSSKWSRSSVSSQFDTVLSQFLDRLIEQSHFNNPAAAFNQSRVSVSSLDDK